MHGIRILNLFCVTSIEFPRHSRLAIFITLTSLKFYICALFFEKTLEVKDNLVYVSKGNIYFKCMLITHIRQPHKSSNSGITSK